MELQIVQSRKVIKKSSIMRAVWFIFLLFFFISPRNFQGLHITTPPFFLFFLSFFFNYIYLLVYLLPPFSILKTPTLFFTLKIQTCM